MVGGDEKEHTGTGLQDNRAAWRRNGCVESGSLATTDDASDIEKRSVRAGLKICDENAGEP